MSYGQTIYLRNEPRHDIIRDNNLLISKCSSKFVTGIFLYNLVAKQYTSIALLALIVRKDSRFNGILNCQLVTFVCFLNVGMLTSHIFYRESALLLLLGSCYVWYVYITCYLGRYVLRRLYRKENVKCITHTYKWGRWEWEKIFVWTKMICGEIDFKREKRMSQKQNSIEKSLVWVALLCISNQLFWSLK